MMPMETWTTLRMWTSNFLQKLTSTSQRLMEPGGRRDRRESLLSSSLECWWRDHLGQKDQLVFLVPLEPLAPQARLETLESGVLTVVLVCLEPMDCQDLQGLS